MAMLGFSYLSEHAIIQIILARFRNSFVIRTQKSIECYTMLRSSRV